MSKHDVIECVISTSNIICLCSFKSSKNSLYWHILMQFFDKPVRVSFFSGSPYMMTLVSCLIKPQHVCIINILLYNVMLYVVGDVRGVTQLGDIVYAVCAHSPVIKMFTADTLSPLGKGIHVKGMRCPWDIVACHHDRQLYVGDPGGGCIWRVSVSDGHHSYVKWLTGLRDVSTLSLTSRHLFVTSDRQPRVRQYDTTDGQLVREVQLPSYVKQVFHAAETSRGTFVLCHRGTSEDEDQHAVSELFRLCRRSVLL